jgi:predicted CoA-binding protein
MIEQATVDRFLAQRRIAVGVNPNATTAAGVACWPDLARVPGAVDGVIVMVPAAASVDVVRAAIARGVSHVWLFRGIGGPGSVTDEAVALCHEHDVNVVSGACPLMFLEPVGFGHRMHRSVRRMRGTVERPRKEVPA